MNLKIKIGLGLVAFAVLLSLFMVGTQAYFNSKEIRFASEGCLEQGGTIIVETTFMNLDYSFTCE